MFVPVVPMMNCSNFSNNNTDQARLTRAEEEAAKAKEKLRRIDEENKRHQEALDEINGIHHYKPDSENWTSKFFSYYRIDNSANSSMMLDSINQGLDRLYDDIRADFFRCFQHIELTGAENYHGEVFCLDNGHLLMDKVIDYHFKGFKEKIFPFAEDNDTFIEDLKVMAKSEVKDKLRAEARAYATMIRMDYYG